MDPPAFPLLIYSQIARPALVLAARTSTRALKMAASKEKSAKKRGVEL